MPILYQLRTTPISATQILPETIGQITTLANTCASLHVVKESPLHHIVVLSSPHGGHVTGQYGDYLFQDQEGNHHLYPKSKFERTYEPMAKSQCQETSYQQNDTMHQDIQEHLGSVALII